MKMTKEQAHAAVEIVRALADTIRELGTVPSGVLYSNVLGTLSLEQYQSVIRLLKNSGLVSETGHLLRWTGPPPVNE